MGEYLLMNIPYVISTSRLTFHARQSSLCQLRKNTAAEMFEREKVVQLCFKEDKWLSL